MTSQGQKPKPLSALEVKKVVLQALSNEGSYRETWHASNEHLERKIAFADVMFGLKQEWRFCQPDEFSEEHWQWKYTISTVDIEGEPLKIIAGTRY